MPRFDDAHLLAINARILGGLGARPITIRITGPADENPITAMAVVDLNARERTDHTTGLAYTAHAFFAIPADDITGWGQRTTISYAGQTFGKLRQISADTALVELEGQLITPTERRPNTRA